MLPYSNLINIDKESLTPVYLQICNALISQIKAGVLKKGSKLPGTRLLSSMLGVNRNTVVAAYSELENQGWIIKLASKGTVVSDSIPEVKPQSFSGNQKIKSKGEQAGYFIKSNPVMDTHVYVKTALLEINDGFPDIRLAPLDSLSRAIRSVLKGQRGMVHLSYDSIEGNIHLRNEIVKHLNETRGFNVDTKNILVSRGSINALYLCCNVLLEKGDQVIVGELGYKSVNLIIHNLGGKLIKVPVDRWGLSIDAIERIVKKQKVRAIYVTPHHHYPTTVTMSPERRMALVTLAERYGIAILEDDYDYDYHYRHSPFLPLASADPSGMVIYIGSFSKTFSPAFRVGYICAPANLIHEVAKLRRIVDRQGDSILEQALAELFKLGEIKSHLRKTQRIYHARRDLFCGILKENFGDKIDFETPEGGMAVWAKFDKYFPLTELSEKVRKKGLYLFDGANFNSPDNNINSTRMGFASLDLKEIEIALDILKGEMK